MALRSQSLQQWLHLVTAGVVKQLLMLITRRHPTAQKTTKLGGESSGCRIPGEKNICPCSVKQNGLFGRLIQPEECFISIPKFQLRFNSCKWLNSADLGEDLVKLFQKSEVRLCFTSQVLSEKDVLTVVSSAFRRVHV